MRPKAVVRAEHFGGCVGTAAGGAGTGAPAASSRGAEEGPLRFYPRVASSADCIAVSAVTTAKGAMGGRR